MDRTGAGLGQMFIEGGPGMFPVAVSGLVLLVGAVLYARDGEPVRLRFLTAMAVALLGFSVLAFVGDLASVFWFLEDKERAPADELVRILFSGLKESSRPLLLGLFLGCLSSVALAVGVYRVNRRELRAVKAG